VKKAKIKGGYFHNGKGKQFTTLQDALANDTICGCGINCKNGFISLPNFNSVSGDKDGFYGIYVSDGDLVIDTIDNVKNQLNSFCGGGGGGEPQALRLTFDSIENANLLVGDASNVSDWNTFFDLPTNGTAFSAVTISGNTVQLFGGSDIIVKEYLFVIDPNDPFNSPQVGLVSIDDSSGSIIEVQEGAFTYSNTLTSVNLPVCTLISENTQQYGAFNSCINLSTVNIPLLEEAYFSAFYECMSLTEINFPLLTTAGDSCFSTCTSLTTVDLPSLTTAGDSCFYNCTSLTTVDLPSLTTAGYYCFSTCTSLTTVDLPSLTTAEYYCFQSCSSLTTVDLPSLTTAGDACFSTCTSLTTVDLPSLTTAGNSCFQSCSSLTTVDLPSLTTAGDSCFYTCTGLTSINIQTCTNLGTTVGDNFVFGTINGNTITLTVPAALMTANSGSPDGDIAYLQANNTVTVITV